MITVFFFIIYDRRSLRKKGDSFSENFQKADSEDIGICQFSVHYNNLFRNLIFQKRSGITHLFPILSDSAAAAIVSASFSLTDTI